MYEDKTLVCKDCGKEFAAIKASRVMHDAVCANCGAACQVPFEPKDDRPVYCSECYAKLQENGAL